jgi:flagellar assembly protein FliH
MSAKFQRMTGEVKSEPQAVKDVEVTRVEGHSAMSVTDFGVPAIRKPGDRDYNAVRAKYGPLAITDPDRKKRNQHDSHFEMNPLLRDPLSIDEEERRAIADLVRKQVEEQALSAKTEAARRGYDDGFLRGREEASAIVKKSIEEKLESLQKLITSFEGLKSELIATHENLLLDITYRVAKKVLIGELKTDKAYLGRLMRSLIEKLEARENITIRISPEDQALIGELRAELVQSFGQLRNLAIETSPSVRKGGCIIDTDFEQIDASIESQFDEIKKSLDGQASAG